MDQQRQKAFQKLRPVCVELSSIVLRFKGHQTSVKEVLHALENQQNVLQELGSQNQLDEKLAEYSFFPLTHIFNQSQVLSSACVQIAVQSVTVLVSQGWRSKLSPEMGKQLLILMSLIAGGNPRKQATAPSDELKSTVFTCMGTLIRALLLSARGKTVFEDQGTRNVVDQLAYLLVDSLTEAPSEEVQIAAAQALLELNASLDRVFLASLLPRTVSSLTKALRPSTKARRTRKVLNTNLNLLGHILKSVLADNVVLSEDRPKSEQDALDKSWLKATTAQIKNAIAQVCKLRTHDQVDVRNALFNFCIMIIEDCGTTLHESVPIMLETCVVLTSYADNAEASYKLNTLIMTRPGLAENLQSNFYDWCQSLPRIMQGNDDRPKELTIARISNSFSLLNNTLFSADRIANTLGPTILRSITSTVNESQSKSIQMYTDKPSQEFSLTQQNMKQNTFEPVLFNHQSQKDSSQALQKLIENLKQHDSSRTIIRNIIDGMVDLGPTQKIAPIWLAIQLLRRGADPVLELDDFLNIADVSSEKETSRAYLIQDLYSQTKEILLDSSPYSSDITVDYRTIALALESVALQAQQLRQDYRTELCETLYPIIALFSSRNDIVRKHAVTTLNILATSCEYNSVSALLIENVDYLVNSIAWKLNTFNLSPEAPAVLNMIIRLVGAKVIPYLDDLITSIFAALDNYHGYPQWVEMLFEVLRTMVDESVKTPSIAISDGNEVPPHKKSQLHISTVDDILEDLRARKRRKISSETLAHSSDIERAPHRPWTKPQDDPTYKPDPTEGKDLETLLREAETANEENDLPPPKEPEDEDPTKPLSKSHDLLLKIARATVPHLSSPSPRVRHILLQLLLQISPLMARHENTFLPLINAIWPGLVQRLFADIGTYTSEEQDSQGETAYNVAAVADVIATLCENAGDFMAGRIEQILAQLKTMYRRLWKDIQGQMLWNKRSEYIERSSISVNEDTAGSKIKGVVDLQVIKTMGEISSATSKNTQSSIMALTPVSRTSTGQVFTSLVHILISVLSHVEISVDSADDIFDMLTPLLDYPGEVGTMVHHILTTYNSDTIWVKKCRKEVENEIKNGTRRIDDRVWKTVEIPAMRGEGVVLQPVVF